jgi:hypothetical protein
LRITPNDSLPRYDLAPSSLELPVDTSDWANTKHLNSINPKIVPHPVENTFAGNGGKTRYLAAWKAVKLIQNVIVQDRKYRTSCQRQLPCVTIKVKVRSSQNRIVTATANEITKANEEGMRRQRTANVVQSNNVMPPAMQRNRQACCGKPRLSSGFM